MKLKSIKNVMAGLTASLMLATFVPTTVLAVDSTDPVSKGKLEVVVSEEVSKVDFSNLGIDNIINGINNTVKDVVNGTVQGIVEKLVTSDSIKNTLASEEFRGLIKTTVEEVVNNLLANAGITSQGTITSVTNTVIDRVLDELANSDIVEKVLTHELVQSIIDRTIEYAVSDIMDTIKLPTAGEVIETSKEELTSNVIEDVWNSDEALKKTLYYEYEIKLEGWRPVTTLKGWKRSGISGKIQLDLLKVVGDATQTPDLSTINYEEIVLNAAKRAAKDVINERIDAIKVQIRQEVEAVATKIVNEVKKEIENAVNQAKNEINNKINSIKDKLGFIKK